MTENKRFTWKTVHGWQTPAFLEVMNGLDKKNQQLKKENEQLKEALKELKEIGDYQEMRIQELCDMHSLIGDEIDKKIAVLTDAKIKSF